MNPFNNGNFPTHPPFSSVPLPKAKTSMRLLTKQNLGVYKKLSLTSVIDTSNKAINAFNSFVPLYHEIKPMIENGRSAINGIKSFVNKRKKNDEVKTVTKEKETVEVEVVNDYKEKEIKKENKQEQFQEQREPPPPFYGN